jgi:hypothetical protein
VVGEEAVVGDEDEAADVEVGEAVPVWLVLRMTRGRKFRGRGRRRIRVRVRITIGRLSGGRRWQELASLRRRVREKYDDSRICEAVIVL